MDSIVIRILILFPNIIWKPFSSIKTYFGIFLLFEMWYFSVIHFNVIHCLLFNVILFIIQCNILFHLSYYSVPWIRMSGGRVKLDLDSILSGCGFLTMLPSDDLLNFGYTGNNHLPLTTVCFWVRLRKNVFQNRFYGKLGVVLALTSQ